MLINSTTSNPRCSSTTGKTIVVLPLVYSSVFSNYSKEEEFLFAIHYPSSTDMREKPISGIRFRLHVVIPGQYDFADAGSRKLVDELLTRIRNSSMVLDNVSELEENWMDVYQMWNGGIGDRYGMLYFYSRRDSKP